MKRSSLFIAAAIALVAVFVAGSVLYLGLFKGASGGRIDESLLVRPHSVVEGPRSAKVNIVEFLDPACGTCAEFYPFVHRLMDKHAGRVRLTVRYAPFHPNSDQVVRMLEAARKQGKWKEALEVLFSTQAAWAPNHSPQPELAWQQLARLGLDMDRARQDANSPEVAQRIEQDIADARALNVAATPEFFVNGKPMPSFGYEQLTALVDEALAQAYP
jgi:protein-disulfide isomerase